jgi:hypothetical protein
MLLKLGTNCRSRAESLGALQGFVIEPIERLLLKIVVEEPHAEPLSRVRVAFGRIDHADADQVVLGVSAAEFRQLAQADADPLGRKRPAGRRRRGDEPPERALSARSKIECRDGEVSNLVAITVDARTGDLESVIFPLGMPMTRDIVVGVDQVAEVRDDRIVLKCDMDDLAEFPTHRV